VLQDYSKVLRVGFCITTRPSKGSASIMDGTCMYPHGCSKQISDRPALSRNSEDRFHETSQARRPQKTVQQQHPQSAGYSGWY